MVYGSGLIAAAMALGLLTEAECVRRSFLSATSPLGYRGGSQSHPSDSRRAGQPPQGVPQTQLIPPDSHVMPPQFQPEEYPYNPGDAGSFPTTYSADLGDYATDEDPLHETVQDRLDSWKQKQQELAATARQSVRDDQGRVKLLTSVTRGSRATVFVILLFRALFLYEVADQKHTGVRRLLLVVPVCLLLVGNLAGVVASFTSPSHSAKKRLKAIMNCNKFVETVLILYSFLRLTILPSNYTPREIFVASIFHSVFFILQAQAFTKLSWDDKGPLATSASLSSGPMGAAPPSSTSGAPLQRLGPAPDEWSQGLPPSRRQGFQ